jgi:hypothetical protein
MFEGVDGMREMQYVMKMFRFGFKTIGGSEVMNILEHGGKPVEPQGCSTIEYLLADGNDYQTGLGYICANMGQRASYTKGFAQITRILLHEYGHQMTYDTIIALYGEDAMDNLYREAGSDNALYVSVPAEFVATQWAIKWLADAENRKIAREFERKFWACFA